MSTQTEIKQNLSELLAKEMDRKDFLKHLAVAAVALTGVAGIITTLSGQRFTGLSQANNNAQGYGSLPYGGNKS